MPWFLIAIPESFRPRQMCRAPIVVLLDKCISQIMQRGSSLPYIIKQARMFEAACDRAAHEGPVGERSRRYTACASAAPAVVRIQVGLSGQKWRRVGGVVNTGD